MPYIEDFEEKLNELEKNELTPENLERLVLDTLNNSKENRDEFSKEIFILTINKLKNSKTLNKEYIKAVIDAIIKANTKNLIETIEKLNEEKRKILNDLEKKQDEYTQRINSILENIRMIFVEEENIKKEIEESINELTSQNERAVFEMQKSIKNDIKKAVEENKNLSNELKKTVNENIKKALENSELTISQSKEIFKKAILSVKEVSEELNLDVKKNLEVAIKSAEDYVLMQINELKNYLDESKKDIKDVFQKDVQKTLENLEIIYIGMIEAIGEFSQKSEKFIQEELDDMKKKIAEIKNEVTEILIQKIEILKEESEEALKKARERTKILTDEMKQKLENLSGKIAKVTKGAINGMIEGAKKALEEEKH